MSLFAMVKDINSRRYGKCYKIISKWKVTANSRYEYKVIMNSTALKKQDLPKVKACQACVNSQLFGIFFKTNVAQSVVELVFTL